MKSTDEIDRQKGDLQTLPDEVLPLAMELQTQRIVGLADLDLLAGDLLLLLVQVGELLLLM